MTQPPKPMSVKRLETRRRLVEAAAQAVAEKGFRDTTLDAIAARAGLTKGAIYDNFRSKEELFFEVMACNPSRLPMPPDPFADTESKLLAMASEVTSDETARLQIPLRAEFLLYSLAHPEMRPMMTGWLEQGFAAESDAVARAFAPEELALSPKAFVALLQAMIPGLMYLRSQAPALISDEVVAEIFRSLASRRPC